jgi:glycosyltransferase involved in cell wall biosynthesis
MFLFSFDFCSIFQRKNPMAVIEAFKHAFVDRNDVQLVIKSHNGHHFRHVLEKSLAEIKGDRRITWMDMSMDQQRRYDLMNACDCYVSLHRSEGFGLTMAEAMLLEKPVIATGYSGNLDFMTQDNSFLCGYALIHVGQGYYPYPPEGVWAGVDVSQAAEWMVHVVDNREEARGIAAKGHADVARNHSFSAVGKAIEARKSVLNYPRYLKDLVSYYVRGIGRRIVRLF